MMSYFAKYFCLRLCRDVIFQCVLFILIFIFSDGMHIVCFQICFDYFYLL